MFHAICPIRQTIRRPTRSGPLESSMYSGIIGSHNFSKAQERRAERLCSLKAICCFLALSLALRFSALSFLLIFCFSRFFPSFQFYHNILLRHQFRQLTLPRVTDCRNFAFLGLFRLDFSGFPIVNRVRGNAQQNSETPLGKAKFHSQLFDPTRRNTYRLFCSRRIYGWLYRLRRREYHVLQRLDSTALFRNGLSHRRKLLLQICKLVPDFPSGQTANFFVQDFLNIRHGNRS